MEQFIEYISAWQIEHPVDNSYSAGGEQGTPFERLQGLKEDFQGQVTEVSNGLFYCFRCG